MKSILPLIFVVLLLTGAIVYSLTRSTLPKLVAKQFGPPATELEINDSLVTPTPTATPTPTVSLVKGRSGEAERDLTPTLALKPTVTL
jgi:hypothetical protein